MVEGKVPTLLSLTVFMGFLMSYLGLDVCSTLNVYRSDQSSSTKHL